MGGPTGHPLWLIQAVMAKQWGQALDWASVVQLYPVLFFHRETQRVPGIPAVFSVWVGVPGWKDRDGIELLDTPQFLAYISGWSSHHSEEPERVASRPSLWVPSEIAHETKSCSIVEGQFPFAIFYPTDNVLTVRCGEPALGQSLAVKA